MSVLKNYKLGWRSKQLPWCVSAIGVFDFGVVFSIKIEQVWMLSFSSASELSSFLAVCLPFVVHIYCCCVGTMEIFSIMCSP